MIQSSAITARDPWLMMFTGDSDLDQGNGGKGRVKDYKMNISSLY